MKRQAPVATELTWRQVHAFRLERHHLTKRASKKDLADVTGDIGGAQAQVMSAAEMQIGVRADCAATDVRAALWKDRKLVKTWLMRGTLHLIPAQDLPLYTAAMRTRWIKPRNTWLKFFQMTEAQWTALSQTIGDAMSDKPMTREQIIAVAGKGQSEPVRQWLKSGWGGFLKPVARAGLLCFGPSQGQNVTFVRPDLWLGKWRDVDPDTALAEVARRYLRTYGPATKTDFARWWGNWTGVGNAAWAGLAGELAPVSIEGLRADMLAADVDRISAAPAGPSVQMLPLFDPYLMGHASRDHLVDAAHASRVSRTAGWISAVVLVDGRVAGTWTHAVTKQTLRITIDPFRRLPAAVTRAVRSRAESLAGILGMTNLEVKIAR